MIPEHLFNPTNVRIINKETGEEIVVQSVDISEIKLINENGYAGSLMPITSGSIFYEDIKFNSESFVRLSGKQDDPKFKRLLMLQKKTKKKRIKNKLNNRIINEILELNNQ